MGEGDKLKAIFKKNQHIITIGLVLVSAVLITLVVFYRARQQGHGCAIAYPVIDDSGTNYLGPNQRKECVQLERVSSPQDKAIGLSKYDTLPKNQGMLFVYDQPQNVCIWMKNMKFDINIIWLGKDKEILEIKEEVKPETYPETFCVDSAQYVIEVSPGVSQQAGLQPGQILEF